MSDLTKLKALPKVSVHGGHSGQFCNHAVDSLEEVIKAYIDQGFTWVGITEHLPPMNDAMRYPDEADAGLSADFLQQRFLAYFEHCRALAAEYAGQIEILVAFETETYADSEAYIRHWVETVKPDYLVGSVHHVDAIGIDFNQAYFEQAVNHSGSREALYCAYFDAQFEMLTALEPSVVGHLDLIRKFDPDYLETLSDQSVIERISRNLDFIAEKNLIIDFNLRGFDKCQEQYPCGPVLNMAVEREIAVVPGDDSHGVASVGRNYERGLEVLAAAGVSGPWRKPLRIKYA